MRWGLSLGIQSNSDGRDLTVRLTREDEAGAGVSAPLRLTATLLLCAPLIWTLGQGVLQAVHVLTPSTATGVDPLIVRVWAFIGPVVALALNLWWSGHAQLTRSGERTIAGRLSFSLDPVSVSLILLAGFLVAAFYGHLLADAWACSNGIRSAC